jgi:short-subunit dehydrogenase
MAINAFQAHLESISKPTPRSSLYFQEKLDKVKAELEAIHADCYVKTLLFEFGTSQDYSYLRENLASLDIGFALNSVGVGREQLERYGDNPEADSHILRINALGAAEFLSCVLPPMEAHGGGQVVVLSSSQGYRPIPWLAAYSASKTLMTFLAEAIDRERATIRVQTLTPALVATNMTYYTVRQPF